MMRKIIISYVLILLQFEYFINTSAKFMLKNKKEILTPYNLDEIYQTNLQHEMVIDFFKKNSWKNKNLK